MEEGAQPHSDMAHALLATGSVLRTVVEQYLCAGLFVVSFQVLAGETGGIMPDVLRST